METITLNSKIPVSVGEFHLDNKEYMQYLYLPIMFPDYEEMVVEERLEFLLPMIECAVRDMGKDISNDLYCYLTIKQTFVPKGIDQNRPGWHADGFGTNDVQYIYFDKWPTEFLVGDIEVRNDDVLSMQDMNHAYDKGIGDVYSPEPFHLYRLDQNNIHRTIPAPENGVRMFVKITFSEHQYAQEGNSHNYEIDYNWDLKPRKEDRNQPHIAL